MFQVLEGFLASFAGGIFINVGFLCFRIAERLRIFTDDPRWLPIRPNEALVPVMIFSRVSIAHVVISLVILFFVTFDLFLFFAIFAPLVEFFLVAFACRVLLEYGLRKELKHMTPQELEYYHTQLKK